MAGAFFVCVGIKIQKKMKVRVQREIFLGGNCLYRSLATGLIFQYTGFNCGSGGVPNKEKTLARLFITLL